MHQELSGVCSRGLQMRILWYIFGTPRLDCKWGSWHPFLFYYMIPFLQHQDLTGNGEAGILSCSTTWFHFCNTNTWLVMGKLASFLVLLHDSIFATPKLDWEWGSWHPFLFYYMIPFLQHQDLTGNGEAGILSCSTTWFTGAISCGFRLMNVKHWFTGAISCGFRLMNVKHCLTGGISWGFRLMNMYQEICSNKNYCSGSRWTSVSITA